MKLFRRCLALIGLSLMMGQSVASEPAPDFLWAKQDGGMDAGGWSAHVDNDHHLFVVGYTASALSGQVQHGKVDYWLYNGYAYAADEHLCWFIQDGVKNAFTFPVGIGLDDNHNVYVAANVNLDSSPNFYALLTKYNDGILAWRKQIEGAIANGIVTDNDGNSFLVGGIQDNLFLAKYNSSGALLWNKKFKTPDSADYGLQIALNNRHIYVTGYSFHYTDMGRYFFIEKYKLDGSSEGRLKFNPFMEPSGLATDSNDSSIYVSGTRQGDECYLVKYSTEDQIQWAKKMDAYTGPCEAGEISLDEYGNIYMTGTVDYSTAYFIAKFDAKGNLIWHIKAGTISKDAVTGHGISVDRMGDIFVTGYTAGSLHQQPMIGRYDYFIAKYE